MFSHTSKLRAGWFAWATGSYCIVGHTLYVVVHAGKDGDAVMFSELVHGTITAGALL
jgi:hypothetical protein